MQMKTKLEHRCFSENFSKFLKTPFLTEHLWVTAADIWMQVVIYSLNLSLQFVTIKFEFSR